MQNNKNPQTKTTPQIEIYNYEVEDGRVYILYGIGRYPNELFITKKLAVEWFNQSGHDLQISNFMEAGEHKQSEFYFDYDQFMETEFDQDYAVELVEYVIKNQHLNIKS